MPDRKPDKYTALQIAAKMGLVAVARQLAASGAHPCPTEIQDESVSPLRLAMAADRSFQHRFLRYVELEQSYREVRPPKAPEPNKASTTSGQIPCSLRRCRGRRGCLCPKAIEEAQAVYFKDLTPPAPTPPPLKPAKPEGLAKQLWRQVAGVTDPSVGQLRQIAFNCIGAGCDAYVRESPTVAAVFEAYRAQVARTMALSDYAPDTADRVISMIRLIEQSGFGPHKLPLKQLRQKATAALLAAGQLPSLPGSRTFKFGDVSDDGGGGDSITGSTRQLKTTADHAVAGDIAKDIKDPKQVMQQHRQGAAPTWTPFPATLDQAGWLWGEHCEKEKKSIADGNKVGPTGQIEGLVGKTFKAGDENTAAITEGSGGGKKPAADRASRARLQPALMQQSRGDPQAADGLIQQLLSVRRKLYDNEHDARAAAAFKVPDGPMKGWTNLHYAAWGGRELEATALMALGANASLALPTCRSGDEAPADVIGWSGFAPLHLAAAGGHTRVVEVLLAAGAQHHVEALAANGAMVTPLTLATAAGHLDTIAALQACYEKSAGDYAKEWWRSEIRDAPTTSTGLAADALLQHGRVLDKTRDLLDISVRAAVPLDSKVMVALWRRFAEEAVAELGLALTGATAALEALATGVVNLDWATGQIDQIKTTLTRAGVGGVAADVREVTALRQALGVLETNTADLARSAQASMIQLLLEHDADVIRNLETIGEHEWDVFEAALQGCL